MSFSGRLHYLAARGCLVAIILLAALVGECSAQPNSPATDQKANSQQSASDKAGTMPAPQQPQAVFVAEQQKADSPGYDPHCENPKGHEDADLCEQRRMSQAAINAVWWASFQSKIGILGFVAVLLSLFFTGWAAVAAGRAAKAALDALAVERPWVALGSVENIHVRNCRIEGEQVGYTLGTRVTWKNYGRTPAFEVKVMMSRRAVDNDVTPII